MGFPSEETSRDRGGRRRGPLPRPHARGGAAADAADPGSGGCARQRPPGTGLCHRARRAGCHEVRTLAAYVRALGGRLEITADIGGERIALR